jgi:hypothetical protein
MNGANAFINISRGEYLQKIIIAIFFLSISCLFFNKVFTSDYGIHLSIGKQIVETRKIPDKEFLVYPALNDPMNFEETGFQIILYLVYSLVGTEGVSVFVWLIATTAFLFLYKSLRAREINPYIALLTLLIFAIAFRIRLQPRPEIFSYLFCSFLIYACSLFYYKEKRKIIYSIPFVFLVWANIHPSTLAGLGIVGAFGTQSLIIAYRERNNREVIKNSLLIPLGIFLLSFLATLMSKHGLDSVMTPIRLVTSATMTENISEMISLKNTAFYQYYKYLAGLAAASALLGLISFRIRIHDILMAFYGLRVGFQVARAMAFTSIFTIPLVAYSVDGAIKKLNEYLVRKSNMNPSEKDRKSAEKGKGKIAKKEKSKKTGKAENAGAVPAVSGSRVFAGVMVLLLWSFFLTASLGGAFYIYKGMKDQVQQGIGLTEHKFSLKSSEFLRNIDIKGNMFNFFDLGGFIDWQLSPKKLAFIDGRGGKQFTEHQLVTGASKEIENIFEKYDITYIVTKTADSSGMILPMIKYLSENPRWELVFADGLTVVYLKNTSENKDIVDKYRLPKKAIVHQIMQELFHYTYLGVNKLYVYSFIGNMYMDSHDYANALLFYKMAYEINDDPRLGEFIHRLETMKRTM